MTAAPGSILAAALATRTLHLGAICAPLHRPAGASSGASSDSLARLTDRLLPDPALREKLALAAEQAAEGRYVTGCLGVVLHIVATVPLGRTMDAVVTGVWAVSRPGGRWLRRASRYSAALARIAATHVAAVVVRGGPVSDAVTAAATIGALLLLAGAMIGVHGGRQGSAQGAVVVAAGVEAIPLVGFYYLLHKLQRSSELYGTLGIAALLLWLTILARLITSATS